MGGFDGQFAIVAEAQDWTFCGAGGPARVIKIFEPASVVACHLIGDREREFRGVVLPFLAGREKGIVVQVPACDGVGDERARALPVSEEV